jgi:hypothetical protein
VNLVFALQQGMVCIALDAKSVVFALQQGGDCNASLIYALQQR